MTICECTRANQKIFEKFYVCLRARKSWDPFSNRFLGVPEGRKFTATGWLSKPFSCFLCRLLMTVMQTTMRTLRKPRFRPQSEGFAFFAASLAATFALFCRRRLLSLSSTSVAWLCSAGGKCAIFWNHACALGLSAARASAFWSEFERVDGVRAVGVPTPLEVCDGGGVSGRFIVLSPGVEVFMQDRCAARPLLQPVPRTWTRLRASPYSRRPPRR
jgi:hypothetical protein